MAKYKLKKFVTVRCGQNLEKFSLPDFKMSQENPNDQQPKFVNRKLQKKMRNEQKQQKQQQQQQQQQGNQDVNKGQPRKESNRQQQQQHQGGGHGNQRQQPHGRGSQQQNQQQSNQQGQNKSDNNQNNQSAASVSVEPTSGISSLFSHIPSVHKWSSKELLEQIRPQDRALIHPSLIEFALQTSQDISLDEDERTRKFLLMMKRQINDEPALPKEQFRAALFNLLKRTMTLLTCIRLNTIGIGNSVRFIKRQLTETQMETEELRSTLMEALDSFIEDKINDVANFLSKTTANTIVDGDVIMTYGYSPIICKALKIAADNKVKFRVIVVDSRPNFDSRTLIEQISDLDVRYVLISGLSYVMPEVKKVLIEPNGILSNNAAQTPIGTAMISMVAHECGVPVIFVCGSYRFVSDVRIDALSKNERISDELLQPVPIPNMKTDAEYLALIYDVTPGEYVDVVMSELGNIPVNSISTNIKFIQDSYTMFSKKKTNTTTAKK